MLNNMEISGKIIIKVYREMQDEKYKKQQQNGASSLADPSESQNQIEEKKEMKKE